MAYPYIEIEVGLAVLHVQRRGERAAERHETSLQKKFSHAGLSHPTNVVNRFCFLVFLILEFICRDGELDELPFIASFDDFAIRGQIARQKDCLHTVQN